MSEHYGSLGQW